MGRDLNYEDDFEEVPLIEEREVLSRSFDGNFMCRSNDLLN